MRLSIDDLRSDARLAWRGLRRAKSFSLAAILTLALGIAGTTAMFTLLQGVVLRPLPVRDENRLIVAWKELRAAGGVHHAFGGRAIDAVRESSRLMEKVAGVDAHAAGPEVIVEADQASYVKSTVVTGAFFDVLGVESVLGRPLVAEDDVDGAELVVVISRGLWRRRYGGMRDVIGRHVTLSEKRFTIVGVMPDIGYPAGVEVWRTTRSYGTDGPFGDAAREEIDLVGRLRPGVSVSQATSELTELTRQLERVAPAGATRGLMPVVAPFADAAVGGVRIALVALMAAVGLVLLIACANAANLLLMRGEGRRTELAIREALGAGRGRIVRQLVVESLMLTLAAAALGFMVAAWGLQSLLTLVPDGLPRLESVRVDGTVVLFTLVVVLLTTALAGLAPAVTLARAGDWSALHAGRGMPGPAHRRGRRALVVAQIALAVTVLAAAGLLIRSVLRLEAIDLGIAADRLVLVELMLPGARYGSQARHAGFLDAAITRLQAAPAIVAATPVNIAPFSGEGWDVPRFTADGQSADRAAANPSLNLESIYPNYFATLAIPIVAGRAFTPSDRAGAIGVAIVSEDVASATWPGEDAIGKRLRIGDSGSHEPWLTVVGVAASTRYRDIARPLPTIYLPAAQFLDTAEMFVVRSSAPAAMVATLARDQLRTIDPDVRVMRVASFARMLDRPLVRPRFNALLLGLFGGAALLLSAIGLYAVMGAYVRARDREIAVRLALGATGADLRRLVLGEALSLAAMGAITGLLVALVATRLVRGLLFQIDPLDPATLVGAALVLVLASALASYVPMRRATRLDATAVLRS